MAKKPEPRKSPSGRVTIMPAVSKADRESLEDILAGSPEGVDLVQAIIDAGWRRVVKPAK